MKHNVQMQIVNNIEINPVPRNISSSLNHAKVAIPASNVTIQTKMIVE